MIKIDHISLKYTTGESVKIIDQTCLPHEEVWLECEDLKTMEHAIKKLKVRGAPLIGLFANFCLASLANKGFAKADLLTASEVLKNSRPTAVNLIHYINDFQNKIKEIDATNWIEAWSLDNWKVDKEASDKMADYGSSLVSAGDNILTHCNTGSLAAAGRGTAFSVLCESYKRHGDTMVYVDETRPLLQGGRLTTWELSKREVPYKLICDNMAASLMQAKKINSIFVGADRITANGDTANKIGTYSLAVLANYHKVPFYIVAPQKTFDFNLASGKDIPIEERNSEEVRGWVHPKGNHLWAPDCETYNPAFDVTPANLITAWVTEKGIFKSIIKEALSCGQ